MDKILVFVLFLLPILVSSQVFSSLITGFMVRTQETYDCQPGSYFKQIRRSSLIRSYRPDCNPITIQGEGSNKYQAINWNGNAGLFDADVKRVFNVTVEYEGKYRMEYLQTGPIIEKISFTECDGGQISNEQEYLYNATDCARQYLYLNSVKARIHIGVKCHSVCWGNVTMK